MGLVDVFGKDATVEISVNELLEYFERYSRGAIEAEYLKNGIKAGVPHPYLMGIITGEPVEEEVLFPEEGCIDSHDPYWDEDELNGDEVLFEEKATMYKNALTGFVFVLTDKGYECTPDDIKHERSVGKSVKGYERRVPEGWLTKEYVVMVPEEGAVNEENTE